MAKKLPAELVDMVIDQLHYDGRALRACALVAKTWTPRARSWLFRAIRIGSLIGSMEECQRWPTLICMLSDRFGRYLRHAQHLLVHLRHLRIFLEPHEGAYAWTYLLFKMPAASRIRNLHIDARDCADIIDLACAFRPYIAALDTLSFRACSTTGKQLTQLVDPYPELRMLNISALVTLDDGYLTHDNLPYRHCMPPHRPQTTAPARTFVFGYHLAHSTFCWGSTYFAPRDTVFLRHVFVAGDEIFSATDTFANMTPYIRGVHIDRYSVATTKFLQTLPELRVVQLTFDDYVDCSPAATAFLLLPCLRRTATRLHSLAIEIVGRSKRMDRLSQDDWASLDSMLAQQEWVHLRVFVSIAVNFAQNSVTGRLHELLTTGLPTAFARGSLRIYCDESPGYRLPPPVDFTYLAGADA